MATSTYLKNQLLNHVFRGTGYTAPATVYIGLYTGNGITTSSPIGSEVPSTGSYARVPLTAGFSTAASGVISNDVNIIFNTPTSNWGDVRCIGISNASSSGSLLFYGDLSSSKTILTGESVKINAYNLSINLGDTFDEETYSHLDGTDVPAPPPNIYIYGWGNYLANALLEHVLNNIPYSPPDVYLALYNTVPSANDRYGTELTSVGYSRVQVGGTGSWVNSVSGSTYNINPIIFIETSPCGWNSIQGVGFRDANPAGNLLFTGLFRSRITVGVGDGFKFDSGTLRIILDDSYIGGGGSVPS